MLKTIFGGGNISPSVASHLKNAAVRVAQKVPAPVLAKQFGGGNISPLVSSHLSKQKQKQFGGGNISPSVAAHLAKRNIAKK